MTTLDAAAHAHAAAESMSPPRSPLLGSVSTPPATLRTTHTSTTTTTIVTRRTTLVLDEIVPPSDASSSPLSSPSAAAAHTPSSPVQPAAATVVHTRVRTRTSPHTPRHTPRSTLPPSSAAAATRRSTHAHATREPPRLKVVIPPTPPFLHEVDKRNEREQARRAQLIRHRASQEADDDDNDENEDDAAAFVTPETREATAQFTTPNNSIRSDLLTAFDESDYRRHQITPPPSARMLDHKNPPLPPRKAKKRRRLLDRPLDAATGRIHFTPLSLPLVSLSQSSRQSLSPETSSTFSTDWGSVSSPPRLDTPPGSPVRLASVFRSLADEFAAVQDTPPMRALRAPPRITRAARLSTPPISSRTRSAIYEPTSTMRLRSRQLNPSS